MIQALREESGVTRRVNMRSRRTREKRVMGPNFDPPTHVKKQPLMRDPLESCGRAHVRLSIPFLFLLARPTLSIHDRKQTVCLCGNRAGVGRVEARSTLVCAVAAAPPREIFVGGPRVSELFCCSVGSSQPFSAGSGGARIHRRAARRVDAFGRAREASSTRASPRAARVATRDGLARGVRGVIARENRRGSPRSGVSRPHPPPSAR